MMDHWSAEGLIRHSQVNQLPGIRVDDSAFVTIAVCPWCGTNIAIDLDKALIGKRMVEVR